MLMFACRRMALCGMPTFVYGEPRVENRHNMWSMLRSVRNSSNLPWLVIGDFNEALWQFEHFSSHPRGEPQM